MHKPISCSHCNRAIGWYDTKFYNIVKPVMPAGVVVVAAFLECMFCGARSKFNGMEVKKRAVKAQRAMIAPPIAQARMVA